MIFSSSVTPGDIPPLVGNECRHEIPSRGIDAKLLVTTSNHILVYLEGGGYPSCGHRVNRTGKCRGIQRRATDSEQAMMSAVV